MPKLFNLARMTTPTTGTGTITLGSAVAGFLSFAAAGVSNGDIVYYAIRDGASSEIGYGTYTSAGTTLSRTVLKSTNADNAISLSGTAEVFITPPSAAFILSQLTDPAADRVIFWDDSAGEFAFLSLAPNLVISGTELRALEVWGGAISDETTAITTGTNKLTFSIPYEFTVVGVYATLNTVSSSGTPTFDINEAGTTILSTKIVIDVSEKTGGSAGYQGTAAAAAVISDAVIAAFAEVGIDIDTAGTGAKGAKVFLIGYRSA